MFLNKYVPISSGGDIVCMQEEFILEKRKQSGSNVHFEIIVIRDIVAIVVVDKNTRYTLSKNINLSLIIYSFIIFCQYQKQLRITSMMYHLYHL